MKLMILTTLAILSILSAGCNSLDGVKIYTTDSELEAIVRAQDDEVIPCEAPEFEGHKCVSDEDFVKILRRLNQCEKKRLD